MKNLDTVRLTANTTLELIKKDLTRHFPSTSFDMRIDIPSEPFDMLRIFTCIIIRWSFGPHREEVERLVTRYQSLDWNPTSGALEEVSHMEITKEGFLQQIDYGVDYIFCDGPGVMSDV